MTAPTRPRQGTGDRAVADPAPRDRAPHVPALGFGTRLVAALAAHGPVCPGIDPHPAVLRAWGLPESPEGARDLGYRLVEASAGQVGVVKVQVAFYERYGSAGYRALEAVIGRCRQARLLVVADAKRGDIGSSAAGYADAWLTEDAPLRCDALTVHPYLGYESLRPVVAAAAQGGGGVFVLAVTSNPEGRMLQAATGPGGRTVAAWLAAAAAADNAAHRAAGAPAGPVGLVIGATADVDVAGHGIDVAGFGGCVLAPGYGAQGGRTADLARLFRPVGDRVAVVIGRDLLEAGPSPARIRDRLARHIVDTRAVLHP